MASQLETRFPEQKEQSAIRALTEINISSHESNSMTCGVFDGIMGRVVACVSGKRLIFGMKLESRFKCIVAFIIKLFILIFNLYPANVIVIIIIHRFVLGFGFWNLECACCCCYWQEALISSFESQFKQSPISIAQVAAWFRKIGMEEIGSKGSGFVMVLTEGDVIIVPEGYMVVEACLGDSSAIIMSYSFLLKACSKHWIEKVRAGQGGSVSVARYVILASSS